MVGFYFRSTERDLAGKLGWGYASRTGIWKFISHHFLLFLCVCCFFVSQKTLTSYHQCPVHYAWSGKVLVAPSCLGQKWEPGVSCAVLGQARCAAHRHRFSLVIHFFPYSYNFFPFIFFGIPQLTQVMNCIWPWHLLLCVKSVAAALFISSICLLQMPFLYHN